MFYKWLFKTLDMFVILSMGYMVYTKDFTYLNIVDAYFILVLGVTTLVFPLVVLIHQATPEAESTVKGIKALSLIVTGWWKQPYKISTTLTTVVLLSLTGYTFILAWYVVSTGCLMKYLYWCKSKQVKE